MVGYTSYAGRFGNELYVMTRLFDVKCDSLTTVL